MKINKMLAFFTFLPLGLWVLGCSAAAQPGQGTASTPVLQQIIRGLRKQEAGVRNMRVWATTKYSQLNKDGKRFQDGGQTRLAAVYARGGRFSMRVHDVTGGYLILIRLDSPYMVSSYLATYNGRVGMTYNLKAGYLGRVHPQRTGTISGRPPRLGLSEGRWTGRTFSTWGLPQLLDWDASHNPPAYQQMTLLDFLEHPPHKTAITAHWAADQSGRRVAVLTIIWQSKDVIVLDPARNFSLVQDRQYFAAGWPPLPPGPVRWQTRPGTAFTVTGFWQPAPGVYYPKSVEDEFYAFKISKDRPVDKNIVNVTRVLVNDPKVNSGTFVIHFPMGATVTDESTGQVIHIGGTPQQQMKEIDKAVAAARKAVATQPSARDGGK